MFAVIAVVAFAVALILHLTGGHAALVLDFTLAGLVCVAVHLAFAVAVPWKRP